jgi:hypothetical protein
VIEMKMFLSLMMVAETRNINHMNISPGCRTMYIPRTPATSTKAPVARGVNHVVYTTTVIIIIITNHICRHYQQHEPTLRKPRSAASNASRRFRHTWPWAT